MWQLDQPCSLSIFRDHANHMCPRPWLGSSSNMCCTSCDAWPRPQACLQTSLSCQLHEVPVHASQPVVKQPCKDCHVAPNIPSSADACDLKLCQVVLLLDRIAPNAKAASRAPCYSVDGSGDTATLPALSFESNTAIVQGITPVG